MTILKSITFYMAIDSPFCDALVDQDAMIGGDPVGHKCMNKANHDITIKGINYRVCDECYEFIINNLSNLMAD